jgi:DNA-binding MarR family transcriptional regulator
VAAGDPATFFLDLWRAARLGEALVARELRAAGVPREDEFALLQHLAVAGRPLTRSEVAEQMGVAYMTASDALRRLEGSGDVERLPNPRDGRSHLVRLSPAGAERARAAQAPLRAALERLRPGADGDAAAPGPAEDVARLLQALEAAVGRPDA